MKPEWPRRVACLTAETTELAYYLINPDRIVGVSGFASRPPEAREKNKVSTFTTLRLENLRAANPDLILGFSDLQKDMARELVGEGYNVFISNQRSLKEIEEFFYAAGRLLGAEKKAAEIAGAFFEELAIRERETRAALDGWEPKVYFEEWDEPLITGISWVSELISKMGGRDIFAGKSAGRLARDRYVSAEEIIEKDPDIIIASWCGKKVHFDKMLVRPGWEKISAVKNGRMFEIKSADILAPGPSLIRGARRISEIFMSAAGAHKTGQFALNNG